MVKVDICGRRFLVKLWFVDVCGTDKFRIESMNSTFSYLSISIFNFKDLRNEYVVIVVSVKRDCGLFYINFMITFPHGKSQILVTQIAQISEFQIQFSKKKLF